MASNNCLALWLLIILASHKRWEWHVSTNIDFPLGNQYFHLTSVSHHDGMLPNPANDFLCQISPIQLHIKKCEAVDGKRLITEAKPRSHCHDFFWQTATNPDSRKKNNQGHCSSLQLVLVRQKNRYSSQRSPEFVEAQWMYGNVWDYRGATANHNYLCTCTVRRFEFVLVRSCS